MRNLATVACGEKWRMMSTFNANGGTIVSTNYEHVTQNVGIDRITLFRQRAEPTRIRIWGWTGPLNVVIDSVNEINDDGQEHVVGPINRAVFQPNPAGIWLRVDAWWHWGPTQVLEVTRVEVSRTSNALHMLFYTGDNDEWSNTNLTFHYDRNDPAHRADVSETCETIPKNFWG